MTAEPIYDVAVVGSGFGGSICALRSAELGRSVVVLERGRRYRPEDFPRNVRDIDALFWRYSRRPAAAGLYDVRFFSGLAAVVASGVGGGSLIYANIHVRPDPIVFEDARWPAGTDRATLDPYYDRVEAQIGSAPVPAHLRLPKRDAFRRAGLQLGHEVFDPEEAVTWPGQPAVGDGDIDPAGPKPPGVCGMIAECEFGCPLGAKRSMDRTYLLEAEHLGAEVRTGALVSHVRPHPAGYEVSYRNIESGRRDTVIGRRLVLAAGTLGTTEILLRSRDETRTLPGLSDGLGRGFSANRRLPGLGACRRQRSRPVPRTRRDLGDAIFDVAPEFTMAAPTFSAPVMQVLASLGQPSGRWLRPLSGRLWPHLPRLLEFGFSSGLLARPAPRPFGHRGDPRRTTNLFCIGRDNANGRMRLGPNGLDVAWSYAEENGELIRRMEEAMNVVRGLLRRNIRRPVHLEHLPAHHHRAPSGWVRYG